MNAVRAYLEYQSDRVEALLATHHAPAHVMGGSIGPTIVKLNLQPAPYTRYSKIEGLTNDLAIALQVSQLRISRSKAGIVLEFPRPDPQQASFFSLLTKIMPMPVSAALLGLTSAGEPLVTRLSSPEVTHILVSGTTGSGKSVLLRTIAASLTFSHRSDLMRLILIDHTGRTFPPFTNVPHLACPIITNSKSAGDALRSAVALMEQRDADSEVPGPGTPRVVIFIDELADLMMKTSKGVEKALTRLLQRGREGGIHVITATQRPSATVLSGLMRANFPLRLVGKVVSASDATIAAGRGGTNAHLLNGRGDFLAVYGAGQPTRFQAAFANPKKLAAKLAGIGGHARDILPSVKTLENPAGGWMETGCVRMRESWKWWKENEGKRGTMKKLCSKVFPGKDHAGCWFGRLEKVIEVIENEKQA